MATTTVYVIRAFGGVLIVQSTQRSTSIPTVTALALTHDGIVRALTYDGIVRALTHDGVAKTRTHDGIIKVLTRDGITSARTP